MTFWNTGVPTLMMLAVLGGSASAQGTSAMPAGTSPPSSTGTSQQLPVGGPQQAADCASMHQQAMNAISEKASSPNAAVAQEVIAAGDKACATGDAQTAQIYYQKALILLTGS